MKFDNQYKIIFIILLATIFWRIYPAIFWFEWPKREQFLYNLYILSAVFYLIVLIFSIALFTDESKTAIIENENVKDKNSICVISHLYFWFLIPLTILIGAITVPSSFFMPSDASYMIPTLGTFFKCYYSLVILITILYFVNYSKRYILNFLTAATKILNLLYGAIFLILILCGVYKLLDSIIVEYNSDADFFNIYIVALLLPAVLLVSKRTIRYFIFGYIIALASTYYFHVYKYNHVYEVSFENQGINCFRIDEPILGCSFESVAVNKGDKIETLDGKREISSGSVKTFCANADKGRPFTYYFQLNNTIYKYIHKERTTESK